MPDPTFAKLITPVTQSSSAPSFAKLATPTATAQPTQTPNTQGAGSVGSGGGYNPATDIFGTDTRPAAGFLGNILQNTIGSRGLAGVAQLPGKAIADKIASSDVQKFSDNATMMYDHATNLLKLANTTVDPTQKASLQKQAKALMEGAAVLNGHANEIGNFNTTAKQALGTTINAVTTVAGLKAPVPSSFVGKVADFTGMGALGSSAGALEENKSGGEIAKQGVIGGIIGGLTGGLTGGLEKGFRLLGDAGDKIQTSVIKPSLADVKDGFSINTIKQFNLGGSLNDTYQKTNTKLGELSQQLKQKLASSNASIDLNTAYENTAKRLLGNKLENFGANSQMESAIDKLRNEITHVSGENGLVSIPDAQMLKRAAGNFGAWSYGVPTPESSASQKVYNTFYNELKTSIEKNSPDGVREINQQISKLIPVVNAVIRRIPIAERNSALSLTDIISLSAAAVEPRALGLSLVNLASKSGKFGAALGNVAPKAANFVSNKVAPVARTIVSH